MAVGVMVIGVRVADETVGADLVLNQVIDAAADILGVRSLCRGRSRTDQRGSRQRGHRGGKLLSRPVAGRRLCSSHPLQTPFDRLVPSRILRFRGHRQSRTVKLPSGSAQQAETTGGGEAAERFPAMDRVTHGFEHLVRREQSNRNQDVPGWPLARRPIRSKPIVWESASPVRSAEDRAVHKWEPSQRRIPEPARPRPGPPTGCLDAPWPPR